MQKYNYIINKCQVKLDNPYKKLYNLSLKNYHKKHVLFHVILFLFLK